MSSPTAAVRSWSGVRYAHAARFGAPVQAPFDLASPTGGGGVAPYQAEPEYLELGAPVDEDCLTVSVWAPPASAELKPVVVQLYGGGFEHGANTSWVSDGSRLAANADVVVVAPNYRVGIFGFLSLSQYGEPFQDASNLGLQDVICAIGFIREHAAQFGGDPDQITILGESAGGFLTAALAAVPTVRDTIRRFAVFSAGASRLIPHATASAMADRFLTELGAHNDPERLLQLPAAQLVAAQPSIIATDIGRRNGPAPEAFGIVLDQDLPGGVLEQHPADAIARGAVAHAHMLVSALTDEIGSFRAADPTEFAPTSVAALVDEVHGFGVPHEQALQLVASYGADTADLGDVRERLLTDYIYRLPAARLATTHAAAGGQAHLLLIGGVDGAPATHGSDVPALVGQSFPDATVAARDRDARITAIVRSFVRGDGLPWASVGPSFSAFGLGSASDDATASYMSIVHHWDGVTRP